MKTITLSADERFIEEARRRAKAERRSLNDAFREWIAGYARLPQDVEQIQSLMKELSYATPGKKLSRDEMNER